MSVVRYYSPAEVADWQQRGPEPFDLKLDGWSYAVSQGLPNERGIGLVRGSQRIAAMRWWDAPLHPGSPVAFSSSRKVTVGARELEVHTTSMYEGFAQVVDVVYFNGDRWFARIVFMSCTPSEIDDALSRIVWA